MSCNLSCGEGIALEKQTKKVPVFISVAGGLALAAGILFAAPMILEYVSDGFGKLANSREAQPDDDWGPVIVRRAHPKQSEQEN